tara:strand:- start:280 stop:909 length:630 start_codon:yes stop_codon:yes gene_type:complete
MIDINTEIMFATPLGTTVIPKEVCEMFKPLKGAIQTQSPDDPKHYDAIKDYPKLKQDITDIFTVWVNNTYNYPDQKWKMLTNWITENHKGTPMIRHRHYNCLFSAVLYFDEVVDGHGNLHLENPQDQNDMFFPIKLKNNPTIFNNKHYIAPLYEGLMLFFPSNIVHSHNSYKRGKDEPIRRSFACNFAPIGTYGVGDSYMDTNWLQHNN